MKVVMVVSAAVLLFATHAQAQSPSQVEELVITGEVLKPEITVVISRENLNKAYDLSLEEKFLEKIIQSVEEKPF